MADSNNHSNSWYSHIVFQNDRGSSETGVLVVFFAGVLICILYSVAAFVDRVPLAVMNTREQGPSVLNRNTLCVRRGNQNMHVKSRNKLNEISQQKQCGMVFKKFPCLVCGKLFFQKSDVKRHEVVHTGQKFPCSYCPKQFSQKHGRNLHEKAHQIETDALSSNMFNGR